MPRQFAPTEAAPTVQRAALVPLILRLTLGAVILPHGLQKVFGWFGGAGFSGTMDGFEQAMQLPPYLTGAVMAAEFLGSLGLIFGLLTRLSALGIAAVMFGAVTMVHWRVGFFMDWNDQLQGEGFEFHLLAIGLAVAILFAGPGRWSIDHWRRSRRDTV